MCTTDCLGVSHGMYIYWHDVPKIANSMFIVYPYQQCTADFLIFYNVFTKNTHQPPAADMRFCSWSVIYLSPEACSPFIVQSAETQLTCSSSFAAQSKLYFFFKLLPLLTVVLTKPCSSIWDARTVLHKNFHFSILPHPKPEMMRALNHLLLG